MQNSAECAWENFWIVMEVKVLVVWAADSRKEESFETKNLQRNEWRCPTPS